MHEAGIRFSDIFFLRQFQFAVVGFHAHNAAQFQVRLAQQVALVGQLVTVRRYDCFDFRNIGTAFCAKIQTEFRRLAVRHVVERPDHFQRYVVRLNPRGFFLTESACFGGLKVVDAYQSVEQRQ